MTRYERRICRSSVIFIYRSFFQLTSFLINLLKNSFKLFRIWQYFSLALNNESSKGVDDPIAPRILWLSARQHRGISTRRLRKSADRPETEGVSSCTEHTHLHIFTYIQWYSFGNRLRRRIWIVPFCLVPMDPPSQVHKIRLSPKSSSMDRHICLWNMWIFAHIYLCSHEFRGGKLKLVANVQAVNLCPDYIQPCMLHTKAEYAMTAHYINSTKYTSTLSRGNPACVGKVKSVVCTIMYFL